MSPAMLSTTCPPHETNSYGQSHWGPRYVGFALSPLKSILAAKTFGVREFMVAAWAKYFREGNLDHASAFARAMHEELKAAGLSSDDLARAQVGHSHAITATTAPTAWWLIYHVFSDPAVLADVVSVETLPISLPINLPSSSGQSSISQLFDVYKLICYSFAHHRLTKSSLPSSGVSSKLLWRRTGRVGIARST